MIVNNIDIFEPLFQDLEEDEFLFLQHKIRKKDGNKENIEGDLLIFKDFKSAKEYTLKEGVVKHGERMYISIKKQSFYESDMDPDEWLNQDIVVFPKPDPFDDRVFVDVDDLQYLNCIRKVLDENNIKSYFDYGTVAGRHIVTEPFDRTIIDYNFLRDECELKEGNLKGLLYADVDIPENKMVDFTDKEDIQD